MKPDAVTLAAFRKLVAKLPGVTEDVSCAGTAVESTTFDVGKKSFLFVGVSKGVLTVRFKVHGAKAEIAKLSKKDPERFSVRAGGWAKFSCLDGEPPPMKLLAPWIKESHTLLAER